MINFKNMTFLINNPSSLLSKCIKAHLENLGAKAFFIEDKKYLCSDKINGYIYFTDLIKPDLLCPDFYVKEGKEKKYFLENIQYLSNNNFTCDNLPILYISSHASFNSKVLKELSKNFIDKKIRINSIVIENVSSSNDLDISNIAMFLLSDSSKYIIGETYFLNEGYINE